MSTRTARWSAPGRVNLVGDHTDYCGGLVLPFAIPLRIDVSVRARSDGVLTAHSRQQPQQDLVVALDQLTPLRRTEADSSPNAWSAYVEGAVWQLQAAGVVVPGVDVRVDGSVPLGAGLSSSAALVCATVSALLALVEAAWTPYQVVQAAHQVETQFVGAPVGLMDPMTVVNAKVDHALYLDTRSRGYEQLTLPLSTPDRAHPTGSNLCLLVVDTGRPHRTTGSGYTKLVAASRRAATTLGISSLRDLSAGDLSRLEDPRLRDQARHVLSENRRVKAAADLLRRGRLADLGPLLVRSHRSLSADLHVSTPELDLVVDEALAAGASGARLTGAGLGGCALVLVERGKARHVQQAVLTALTARGRRSCPSWWVTAGAGARPEGPGSNPFDTADSAP